MIDFVHHRGAVFALAGLDPDLNATLQQQGVLRMLNSDHFYDSVDDAVAAFRALPATRR